MPDLITGHPDLGRIGHDSGRLVLHLERVLATPASEVRRALAATRQSRPAPTGEDFRGTDERWDVDEERSGSRVSFTGWIDAEDVETAAGTGAAYHCHFERLVRAIEAGTSERDTEAVDVAVLSTAYLSAFAAALADTD